MGVVQERQGNEAELARAWVEGRSQVLCAITRSFPAAGSAMVEAAVDQAWGELYENGCSGPLDVLLGRWKGLAYLRALNGVRERRRHPTTPIHAAHQSQRPSYRHERRSGAGRAQPSALLVLPTGHRNVARCGWHCSRSSRGG